MKQKKTYFAFIIFISVFSVISLPDRIGDDTARGPQRIRKYIERNCFIARNLNASALFKRGMAQNGL